MESNDFGDMPKLEIAISDQDGSDDAGLIEDWVETQLLPIIPSDVSLVSVDGLDGVGKSTLSETLAKQIGGVHFELDNYLHKNQNCYLDALNLDALKNDLRQSDLAIVEGCLVGAVIQKLGSQCSFAIYVVRTSRMRGQLERDWVDEWELLFKSEDAEVFSAREEESTEKFAALFSNSEVGTETNFSGLRRELVRYHVEEKPHLKADAIIRVVRFQ